MAKEIRADPAALIALADASLAAADLVGDHVRGGYRHLPLATSAFGDLPGAADAQEVGDLLLSDAMAAVAGLVAVLEGDADRLGGAAFAYHEADRQADVRVGGCRQAPL